MRRISKTSIFPFLVMGAFLVFASSCTEDDNEPNNPTNGKTTAVFNPAVTYGTMKDQDGNVYKTVTIGGQTWMAENLRTTKYNDGTAIPLVTDNDQWRYLKTDAYCNYYNTTSTDTIATYGRLYSWYAVNTGKLAPKGWHIPTETEWARLADYLGGYDVAGGKLKEVGTTHWKSPNTGATNETGFTALPGGFRHGGSRNIGSGAYWLSSTENDATSVWSCLVEYSSSDAFRVAETKEFGVSVRCLQD